MDVAVVIHVIVASAATVNAACSNNFDIVLLHLPTLNAYCPPLPRATGVVLVPGLGPFIAACSYILLLRVEGVY